MFRGNKLRGKCRWGETRPALAKAVIRTYVLEADAVLHLKDGRYALIEFKLGSSGIAAGARHLLEIRELVREYNAAQKQMILREPDLMMVITGDKMAYARKDVVKVFPIVCLRD